MVLEACVETLEESIAAERAGADRLELCANMNVSGTTPSAALISAVKAGVRIPVSVMIRPRGGSFVHSAAEVDEMLRSIDVAKRLGADMVVIGVLNDARRIDEKATRRLVLEAGDTPVTFHKAFDEIDDQETALDALIDAGVARVLTSGGAATAWEGRATLSRLVARGNGRLSVMAGGKVRGSNVREIVDTTRVHEVHARSVDESVIRDLRTALAR